MGLWGMGGQNCQLKVGGTVLLHSSSVRPVALSQLARGAFSSLRSAPYKFHQEQTYMNQCYSLKNLTSLSYSNTDIQIQI